MIKKKSPGFPGLFRFRDMANSTGAVAHSWAGTYYRRLGRNDNGCSTTAHAGCRRDRPVPDGSDKQAAVPSNGDHSDSMGGNADDHAASVDDAPANSGGHHDNRNTERSEHSVLEPGRTVSPSKTAAPHSQFRQQRIVPCRVTNMRQTENKQTFSSVSPHSAYRKM